MRLIDEEYTRHPYYGTRRMTEWLNREGYPANRKRVSRLMRLMGLAAIYPGPRLSRGRPEIFNSDQGVQFTSRDFTGRLEKENVRISMDGRGRVFDNIMIERLWRSVKYEEVYLKDYETVRECREGLSAYWSHYNEGRLHQSLDYHTPGELYHEIYRLKE